MTPPKGWELQDTGGGCTSFERELSYSMHTDDHWMITDEGDPSAPTNPDAPCCLGLYINGSPILQWHCSCLAEAITIADGSEYTA